MGIPPHQAPALNAQQLNALSAAVAASLRHDVKDEAHEGHATMDGAVGSGETSGRKTASRRPCGKLDPHKGWSRWLARSATCLRIELVNCCSLVACDLLLLVQAGKLGWEWGALFAKTCRRFLLKSKVAT